MDHLCGVSVARSGNGSPLRCGTADSNMDHKLPREFLSLNILRFLREIGEDDSNEILYEHNGLLPHLRLRKFRYSAKELHLPPSPSTSIVTFSPPRFPKCTTKNFAQISLSLKRTLLRLGEDVAYQLGLLIDGDVVMGETSMDWEIQLQDDANEAVIHQHARAFIFRMIGSFLMPDTLGSRVHLMYLPLLEDLSEIFQYSWGSAVLACLYRGLCRAALISRQIEINGCLQLLQSRAHDRIPILAPRMQDNTTPLFPLVRR
ncbi:hypothetical protein Lal_00042508 [Lupinus albus]|nr:hypothetical protein Lal_00042508 [Lupinus albus]